MATPARGAGGTIYDLGYQHYDGPRLGRPYAIQSLFTHGLRTIFGFGRGIWARGIVWVLAVISVLPAIIQASVTAYVGDAMQLMSYATYTLQASTVYVLFCAAQAPELVSADQRSRALVLYLARALRRDDYVLAKLFALAVSVFVLAMAAQLILFGGRVFASLDAWQAFVDEAPALAPIFGTSVLLALLMSALSVAIASLTPKRSLATAGIVGFFIVSAAMAQILLEAVAADWSRWFVLVNPFLAAGGMNLWLFDEAARQGSELARADLPGWAYASACAGYLGLSLGVLWARYRRMAA